MKTRVTGLARILALSIFFSLFSTSGVFAQRVQPMVFELEPIGNKSSTSLRIDNNKQIPLAMEVLAFRIILDEFGNESLEPAEDDFLIYPPQTLIEANETQMVKVKYVGDPTIRKSQAYRISVNQLPVDLGGEQGGAVGILVNFETLLNVAPKESKAVLNVTEITAVENGKWNLTIENSGDRFSRLSTTSWMVSSDADASNKPVELPDVGGLVSRNLVAPESTVQITIPAIEGLRPDITTITIENGKG